MSKRERADERVADWAKAHEALLDMARERRELEGREGKALLWAMRSEVHAHLGYGSFIEYVERLFGYSPRTTLDKLRTAEALEELPELDHALRKGELTWSAARELARVATPGTEHDWLNASKGRTVRDIERLVAGHERGDRPSDPARPVAMRHVLRFEVAAETLATFRHAMLELRQRSGQHLDDDTALLLMARYVVGRRDPLDDRSSADGGRASYQLALTVCEHCRRGFQDANGERLEVDAPIVAMTGCDAQHIGHVESNVENIGHLESNVDDQSAGTSVSSEPATSSSATPSLVTHVGAPEATGAPSLVTHVGAPEPASVHRATQTIPPALRRHVLCRDQGRCVVPGCRHTTFVDLHHIEPRSEGGRHEPDNLVVLCGAHHRAVHRRQLAISGRASTGLGFEHADGTAYGRAPSAHSITLLEQVFRGLRGLGFKEREARRALDGAWQELGANEAAPSASGLLRAALRRLGPGGVTS